MIADVEKYLLSLETKGVKLGLERTRAFLKTCGSPHKKLKVIQILGTNGKGSTSAILAKLLRLQYNVGLYTSPHLYSLRERIRFNGMPICTQFMQTFINKHSQSIKNLDISFFETMTVMAIAYFKDRGADYAIMETGLGGKFDSVTACKAATFGISSISMDHSHILGDTITKIAQEKIAAIKEKSQVYSVEQKDSVSKLIQSRCVETQSCYNAIKTNFQLQLALKGEHQKQNASLALAIARPLLNNVQLREINDCLLSINWHGRNQELSKSPKVVFDVAHNKDGFQSFLDFIEKIPIENYKKKTLIFSIQKTKVLDNIYKKIDEKFDTIVYSQTSEKHSMKFENIKNHFRDIQYIESPVKAIKAVISEANEDDFIGIVGTHYWGDAVKSFFNICFDNI